MAIKIEWQAMPPHQTEKEEQMRMFPRMKDNGVADEQALCKEAAKNSSLSKGGLCEALSEIVDAMKKLLAEGKTIELPELGTFRLAVGTDEEVTVATRKRMDKIVVRGVNFVPSDELMQALGKPDFQEVAGSVIPSVMPMNRLKEGLSEYFETHDSITRTEFAKLFGLKRSTACSRLKTLVDEGALTVVGWNRDTKYVKGERL